MRPGERALLCRRWLSRADGEAPSPVQAAAWLDIKRLYMEMRPDLRRIYCPVNDIAAYAPIVTPLGFTPIDEAHIDVNGVMFYTAMLDFGEDSVDGWLRGLIDAELRPSGGGVRAAAVQTVLFTDLVGHTEMMQRLGDAAGRRILREHERITRDAISKHGGIEIKTDGDSFMVSFDSVTAAMDCAIRLQRAFETRNNANPEPLSVRMGMNSGEPIEDNGDLFGSSVILAARVAAQAGAGEILVPEPVRHLLAGKGFEFADRGTFLPKGFEDAVRLFEVRWRE
jgi:class 3 adenylate cyclase